jgi:hypothetical protein
MMPGTCPCKGRFSSVGVQSVSDPDKLIHEDTPSYYTGGAPAYVVLISVAVVTGVLVLVLAYFLDHYGLGGIGLTTASGDGDSWNQIIPRAEAPRSVSSHYVRPGFVGSGVQPWRGYRRFLSTTHGGGGILRSKARSLGPGRRAALSRRVR